MCVIVQDIFAEQGHMSESYQGRGRRFDNFKTIIIYDLTFTYPLVESALVN